MEKKYGKSRGQHNGCTELDKRLDQQPCQTKVRELFVDLQICIVFIYNCTPCGSKSVLGKSKQSPETLRETMERTLQSTRKKSEHEESKYNIQNSSTLSDIFLAKERKLAFIAF